MEAFQTASHQLTFSLNQTKPNKEYQNNVKIFIKSVEQEISTLIHKY